LHIDDITATKNSPYHCWVKDTLKLGSIGILKVENSQCGER